MLNDTHRALLAVLVVATAATSGVHADSGCNEQRPGDVFSALEAIDEAGEARLQAALGKLSKQENWSQDDWEKFTLGLADDPGAGAREARRDELVAQIFGILARPPFDCARLDALEAEILEVERQQWNDAVESVERRLRPGKPRTEAL